MKPIAWAPVGTGKRGHFPSAGIYTRLYFIQLQQFVSHKKYQNRYHKTRFMVQNIPKLLPQTPSCIIGILFKGKVKGLDTCYSATYMSQTRDQQRFTISEVAADWQRIMWPSSARANGQLDPRCS